MEAELKKRKLEARKQEATQPPLEGVNHQSIRAAFVRIMKTRLVLNHQQLLEELERALAPRLMPKVRVIKVLISFSKLRSSIINCYWFIDMYRIPG